MASHYRDAAKCLKAVDGGRTTLKTAAYKTQNPPRTVALVSEVRRHRKALETAIAATGLREKAGGDAQLLLVAVYDAVAGRGAPALRRQAAARDPGGVARRADQSIVASMACWWRRELV